MSLLLRRIARCGHTGILLTLTLSEIESRGATALRLLLTKVEDIARALLGGCLLF